MKKEPEKTLRLGYIQPIPALISECFVTHSADCEFPGLKAEVWQAFAEVAGFKLEFQDYWDIGFGATADPSDPVNSTYVLDAVVSGAMNASLALSTMYPVRFAELKYSMPLYFSQNGLVAGKLLNGSQKALRLQVFPWEAIISFALLVLIIGILRRQLWATFAEFIGNQNRRRSLTDSVLALLGLLLLMNYNAGFRGQAATIRRSEKISGSELAKGLSSGTIRIISREPITTTYANDIRLFGRTVTQEELNKVVIVESDSAEIARRLCEDERLICFDFLGGVNTLIGGRWKSTDCILEKVEIPDSNNLTIRVPAGFAMNRNFPKVYRDLLNEVIMTRFYGNQLDRVMRRYDLIPWTKQQQAQDPPSMSFSELSAGFILFAVGCVLSIAAFIVEALIPTTTFDVKSVYPVFAFPAQSTLRHSW